MTTNHHLTGKVHQVTGLRKSLLRFLGWVLRLWQRSLRFDGLEELERVLYSDGRSHLVLLWHNRLFAATAVVGRLKLVEKNMGALISASRDGAWLADFMHTLGILPIRGSSSRRGATAIRQLLHHMRDGHSVVITVDGPRGPCYQAQAGAAMLVSTTQAPVMLLGFEVESAFTLKSWDRFIVPFPFTRVRIKLDRIESPCSTEETRERKAIQVDIQKRLQGLTHDSHLVC